MTRKLSSATPQMARYELPLVRDKREKDRIAKQDRRGIFGEPILSEHGKETRPLFSVSISVEKRLIALNKNDKETENVLYVREIGSYDMHIEFTPFGPEILTRDDGQVSDMALYPNFFIGLTSGEALNIVRHKKRVEKSGPLLEVDVYVVFTDIAVPKIEVASLYTFSEIAREGREFRFFLGRSHCPDPSYVDRVKFE
jgi:hypothetical protein